MLQGPNQCMFLGLEVWGIDCRDPYFGYARAVNYIHDELNNLYFTLTFQQTLLVPIQLVTSSFQRPGGGVLTTLAPVVEARAVARISRLAVRLLGEDRTTDSSAELARPFGTLCLPRWLRSSVRDRTGTAPRSGVGIGIQTSSLLMLRC